MYRRFMINLFVYMSVLLLQVPLNASIWSIWSEYPANPYGSTSIPSNPIFNPFPDVSQSDYAPCVIYDLARFSGNGPASFYKMWHVGPNQKLIGSLNVSYSEDGISWGNTTSTFGFPGGNFPVVLQPCVLYNENSFGTTGEPYKIWYWNGTTGATVASSSIIYAQSVDGENFDSAQGIGEDSSFPLATGSGYFTSVRSPGFVLFNPTPTFETGLPYTFPYVMLYDAVSDTGTLSIALAYTSDMNGVTGWTRFGDTPVLLPGGATGSTATTLWDETDVSRPSLIKVGNFYHMFYSGSNANVDPSTTLSTGHGIGLANSVDGVTWTKDSGNPIFIYSDDFLWRSGRTYQPFVLTSPGGGRCSSKMWFTGGSGPTAGIEQGIGFASVECTGG